MLNLGAIDSGEWVGIVAVGGGFCVAIVAIITDGARKVVQTKHREETKREVAAYVAEGTMKPEDAERIVKADLAASQKGESDGKK